MNSGTHDRSSDLPALPDDLRDQLLAVLFGDPRRRADDLQRLLASAGAHAEAITAHVRFHDSSNARLGDVAAQSANGPARTEAPWPPQDEPLRTSSEQPQSVGPYRILGVLGEGGMGTVYLAEQEEPVRLRVALKLIKLGMDSKEVVARFEQERQALALMEHDGIAKVYNCGTSERGQPYFVMELVHGTPLNRFCEQHRLTLQQRLVLLQQACAAVQHAHQKGVVHRDLKPGNVLVAEEGSSLRIKIIDFGLAKAVGKHGGRTSLFTAVGHVVGTPEYMAPEQADPANPDIDTRADIYSLGVMLYELLTGALPFAGHDLRRAGMLEVQRILREVEPARPSTRLASSPATAATIAAARQMSTSALVRMLAHDLDWVALKALEKDRNRRYETASALAADLQRFLDHEPLLAGPPSTLYRLRKLARRYRGQFVATAAVVLALIGGGVGTFIQYLRAEDRAAVALAQQARAEGQERVANARAEENAKLAAAEATAKLRAQESAAAAEQRTRELEQVLRFQEAQWRDVDTESMGAGLRRALLDAVTEARREDLEAGIEGVNFTNVALGMLQENLFDRSLATIGKSFGDQPLVKARLLQGVADVLLELGLLERATAPQTEALAMQRMAGDDHPDTIFTINGMASLLQAQGKLAEAEPLCAEALERSRRVLGSDDPTTLAAINNHGNLLQAQGKHAEAEPLLVEALERSRRVLGGDDSRTVSAILSMASLLHVQGRLTEAETLYREAVEAGERIQGEDHHQTLVSINNLAAVLRAQARFGDAEDLHRQALARFRRTLGDTHPHTLGSINNLGHLLQEQGRYAEAEQLRQEALAGFRRTLGDENPDTLMAILGMGQLLQAQGKLAAAEPLCQEALDGFRRVVGDRHQRTLNAINTMADLLLQQGKLTEAEPLCREALEQCPRILGEGDVQTVTANRNMGALLMAQGKLAEAEPLMRSALQKSRQTLGGDHPRTLVALNDLAVLLYRQGKLAEAEPYFRETLEKRRAINGDDHPHTLAAIGNLAALLLMRGELVEAEPLLREALKQLQQRLGDQHEYTLTSLHNLGQLMIRMGRHDETVALLSPAEDAARRVWRGGHADRLAMFLRTLGGAMTGRGPTQQFAAAEAKLIEAHTILIAMRGPEHTDTRESVKALVTLYTTWHAAEPTAGHDAKAAEWQTKIPPAPSSAVRK